MSVKVFLSVIALTAIATVTGFAYWLFPILSRFNQAMGGAPLRNPTGDLEQRLNTWASFLPADALQRAVVILAAIGVYVLWTTLATLVALQVRRRHQARQIRAASKARAMHAYNIQQ
jgi:beta-lactamase regulating signal transducer with metallopeptidase domain